MSDGYTMVDADDCERETTETSGVDYVSLLEPLGCTELAPCLWYLDPGDAIAYHRETAQEELYYVLEGPGRMRIEGEVIDVPEGAAVRVAPESARQPFNDTDEGEHVWLIVGAPASRREAEYVDR